MIPIRLVFAAGLAAIAAAGAAFAHHGWGWTSDEDFALTGTIAEIYLGNPHAVLTVTAEDGEWTVELAPPSATARSGFVEGVAAAGDAVTAFGHRSLDESEKRMKAERIVIGDRTYDIYPDRLGDS